jgi:hypothetical protein
MTNVGNYPARKITLRGTFANFENFRKKKGGKPAEIGAFGKSHRIIYISRIRFLRSR